MKAVILLLFFLLPSLVIQAQNQESDSYDSEFIWGINKNTSGGLIGGVVFRKSKRLTDRMYQSIGIELMNVKHPQETRSNSGIGNFYIFGKSNYLYAIRGQYGRELVLFRKAPQQGVEIKAIGAIGPSIGLLAPYFIEFNPDNSGIGGGNRTIAEQYDPNNPKHTPDRILGAGHLFQGIQDSEFKIGVNLKAALSFELGTSKSHVTGFELGFLVDAYTEEIILIPTANNRSIFPTAFITLFYGNRR